MYVCMYGLVGIFVFFPLGLFFIRIFGRARRWSHSTADSGWLPDGWFPLMMCEVGACLLQNHACSVCYIFFFLSMNSDDTRKV